MRDLAFYNVGCEESRGLRRIVVLCRRLVRRLLRPIFFRQVDLFRDNYAQLDRQEQASQELVRRLDQVDAQLQTSLAFGWDYVAMARRLAIIEDRLEALMAEREGRGSVESASAPEARAKVA